MGERGVGGSKCGSTGAVMIAYKKGGTSPLLSTSAVSLTTRPPSAPHAARCTHARVHFRTVTSVVC
jgi:hypothetical protein